MTRRTLLLASGVLWAACSTPSAPQAGSPPPSPAPPSAEASAAPTEAPAAAPPTNLLTLGQGAAVVRASKGAELSAFVALDGDDRTVPIGIPKREPLPHEFVVELPAEATLRRFEVPEFDDYGTAQGDHVRTVKIEGSAVGPDAGFAALAELVLVPGGKAPQDALVAEPKAVRWVKVTLVDRIGAASADADPHRFSELRGYGDQGAVTAPPGAYQGRWRVRRKGIHDDPGPGMVELWQRGEALEGCELRGGEALKVSGTVVDGLARLVTVNERGQQTPSTARVTSEGALVGVSFDGPPRAWYGAPDPTAAPPCSPAAAPSNPIGESLAAGQVAVIYGIQFDVDQDVLKPEATPALEQLLAALTGAPALAVVIEGHTDAQASDAHNLDLSKRRAASVVAWLVARGVEGSRLSPVGKGEAEPLADNATSAGRALNRRVEVEVRSP
jgi:outer membrane protein OmpA-like peptidoglycan-associated protein